MWKLYVVIAFNSLLAAVPGSPIPMISYIQDLNLSYENDQWICGNIECPPGTFGCHIKRQTDSNDKKLLHVIYTCYDENKVGTANATDSLEMAKERTIDIDVESYVGAVSLYSTSYRSGGHEHAEGTISPNDLNELKQSAERTMKTAEDINAMFSH